MSLYDDTKLSGERAEDEIVLILSRYTSLVYRNVRVETRITKQGNTEIDILAAIGDVILIVEAKNVQALIGSILEDDWILKGKETGVEYKGLNPLVQNRIHVRSFKEAYFDVRGSFPRVISCVVVPKGCLLTEEQMCAGIITMDEFNTQIAELAEMHSGVPTYGYTLDYLVGKDKFIKRRCYCGR